ncbi:MAG: energy transducer TonB [Rhodocyclaceae bacterium]|nr:energy transducer TonB [Rhodocyclaceae bacterium]
MFPDPRAAGTPPVPVPSLDQPGKASATEGADAGALLEYRWALTGKAGKPDLKFPAGERASAGRVDIRVTVTPLRTPKVEVAQTSGMRLLDDEALRIMQAAAARAPVPDALKGRPFSVVLPVHFGAENP